MSLWRAALAAAVVLLASRGARAEDTLTVDVTGDGAADHLALVTDHGHPAIRLTLARGRTLWLRVPRPVRHLIATDLDRDGDVDLLATTDGGELVAWFNHGRGRFTRRVIDPRVPGPLGPGGSAIERTVAPARIVFGIGADGALPTEERLSAPVARMLPVFYSTTPSHTAVSAPYGPRAPPAA